MMPVPAWPAAELVETLRTGVPMPDDAMLALVKAQRSLPRRKQLATGLLTAGAITEDQRALLSYLMPELRCA